MTDPFEHFLAELTAPTEAARWLSSPHVTALCEKFAREREEDLNAAETGRKNTVSTKGEMI